MPHSLLYKERRLYNRRACRLIADLDDFESAYAVNIRNIGLGGACIEPIADFKPQIGQEIIMTIPFEKMEDYLIIPGWVAWRHSGGLGVRFKNQASAARKDAPADRS